MSTAQRNRGWSGRPSLISNWTRHHSAVEISGAPVLTLEAFWKEGDLETAFLGSCVPRAARLRRACISYLYFGTTGANITLTLNIQKSTVCALATTIVDSVDVSALIGGAFPARNCMCVDFDSADFDECDQMDLDIVSAGPDHPLSVIVRVVTDWDLK